jgi:nucleotide-binding universal stress UspA family protein
MGRFRKILIYVRDLAQEQRTLRKGVDLARRDDAELTVVGVVRRLPLHMQELFSAIHLSRIQDEVVAERRKELNEFLAPLRSEGVCVAEQVLVGTPFLQIVREVMRNTHDLVMVTAVGRGLFREVLFDPTTMHLIRKCPCPVWALKPSEPEGRPRILAALDPVPSDHVRDSLNAGILKLALSFAEMEQGELHVIHTWSVKLEKSLRGSKQISNEVIREMVEKSRKMHREALNRVLQAHVPQVPPHQIHLLKGEAGTVIPEFTMKKKIGLIVMGTVGRTGVAGLFIGNTAEVVLQQVDCSVLAVKPDGYVSPVKVE